MEPVRLQKHLASLGLASRRKCEDFITSGLVKVNGQIITELGFKVDPEKDFVEFDSQQIKKEKDEFVYILLNKPAGYITSLKQADSDAPLVVDLIKGYPRVYPVGRLDKDSTGLLILTNDGDLAFKLTHPSFDKEKEYLVRTKEKYSMSSLEKIRKGMTIEGVKLNPAKIRLIEDNLASITITEGRNRQIRKMIKKVGNEVVDLQRIRIKNLKLGNLHAGQYRLLTLDEIADLKSE